LPSLPDFCHESPILFDPAMPKVRAGGLVGGSMCVVRTTLRVGPRFHQAVSTCAERT
jgi:hypothetical protein